MISIQFREI